LKLFTKHVSLSTPGSSTSNADVIAMRERALDEIEAAAVANAMMLDEGGIDRCVAAAASMALLFVGVSQEQMLRELAAVHERMTTKLAEIYSDEIATLIAESFVATAATCKAEIEKASVGNSLGGTQ
jgi:hypothetical protein